jgi:hypothetical protein
MRPLFSVTITALLLTACQTDSDPNKAADAQKQYETGMLAPQTPDLLAEEWKIYRSRHMDIDEAAARRQFDIIQIMSAENHDPFVAVWAERKAFANAWLKSEIEDVFSPDIVDDAMIQQAIDAYAFRSGHPALATVSHILIRPDKRSTPQERRQALDAIRNELLKSGELTDDAFRNAAERLTKAGFRTDMNPDLTFPRRPMTSFLGESLDYQTVVQEFADASFQLSAENPISPVIESEFGYHLILFKKMTKEKKASLPKDREFMRAKIVQAGRSMAARQMIQELMKKSDLRVDENRNDLINTK